jgi:two-component system sensor histidine kinase/response regulator
MSNDATQRPTVWVVEDSNLNRKVVVYVLQELGFNVVELDGGGAAIRQIGKTIPTPVIVFCDLMMPTVSGFDVIHEIRMNPDWENVPIVVISAVSERNSVERARELKVTSYLLKPLSATKILDCLERILVDIPIDPLVAQKLRSLGSPGTGAKRKAS